MMRQILKILHNLLIYKDIIKFWLREYKDS